jgi:hypothetical protein
VPSNAKSSSFQHDLLRLIFNAVSIAGLADDAASAAVTALTVALHTADPGESGDQTTNEISYSGYARVSVARTSAGWTVTASSVSPVAVIEFPMMVGGLGGTVTHFSVGTGVDDVMLYRGEVLPNLTIIASVAPRLSTATAITED